MKSLKILVAVAMVATSVDKASAATAEAIKADAEHALQTIYESSPELAAMGKEAKAVLVFPRVVKMGFLLGGAYGEGALMRDGEVANYYNTKSASWGMQAGAQRFGYALFLMTEDAVDYLDRSHGWEIGAGPSVVVVDKGGAAKLSTTTAKSDVYALTFGQRGLMAGVGIEGSKISPIER